MPIAQSPQIPPPVNTSNILLPDVLVPAGTPIPAWTAVAVINTVDGKRFVPCGALPADYPESFFGFLPVEGTPGQAASTVVGRGSLIVPLVEGGGALTPNQDVYLSITPGQVSQSPVTDHDAANVRLGRAVSTTEFVLTMDVRFLIGG